MEDMETSIGTLLDETFARYNSQILSLQERIKELESRISALEGQQKKVVETAGSTDNIVSGKQDEMMASLPNMPVEQSPLQEISTPTNTEVGLCKDGCKNNIDSPALPDSNEVFWATPKIWQGEIALLPNEDKTNAIFRIQFARNEGFVEFNQEAFAFLSGQIEGMLLPYVEYEVLGNGLPSSIRTEECGYAQFDGQYWWLKKKAKLVIQ